MSNQPLGNKYGASVLVSPMTLGGKPRPQYQAKVYDQRFNALGLGSHEYLVRKACSNWVGTWVDAALVAFLPTSEEAVPCVICGAPATRSEYNDYWENRDHLCEDFLCGKQYRQQTGA